MKTRVIVLFSLAVIAGVLCTSYLPDLQGLQSELGVSDRVVTAAGFVSSGASAAAGLLSGTGLLSQPDDVEFAQPVDHEVELDVPPVHRCNPFDHVLLGSGSSIRQSSSNSGDAFRLKRGPLSGRLRAEALPVNNNCDSCNR